MSEAAMLVLGSLAVVSVIGAAGLFYDLVRRTDVPHSWRNGAVHQHAVIMNRYYHDGGPTS